ncbi:MAG: toxin [Gammaproteobacteria bacterium]|nr:toxin [Gammaproteobacteria bacterium]
MSEFDWSNGKNETLGRIRKASFEEVLAHIRKGDVLDVIRHPNRNRYPRQNIIVLDVDGYVWLIPYVKRKGVRFLKTIIPSRKATREYLS